MDVVSNKQRDIAKGKWVKSELEVIAEHYMIIYFEYDFSLRGIKIR